MRICTNTSPSQLIRKGSLERMAKYLITGGAGFIGSHLAGELLEKGHSVVVIDNLSTGSILNINHLKTHPRFEYVIDTVMNHRLMAELVDAADIIYHLAAAVGVRLIIQSPVQTIETNIKCTEIVLAAAAMKRKPVFIASTSEVYGKSEVLPFSEQQDLVMGPTTNSRWSYACSKAIDEFLAIAYWRERKSPTIVGRLFNTVGPRQTGMYGMVLPTFARQALSGLPITVFGSGEQQRCFLHVNDAVRALIALMDLGSHYGEVFNIGATTEVSMIDLAERVRKAANSKSPITLVPYAQAYEVGFEDMLRRVPATDKVASLTGWKATRSLDEIIDDVVRWQKQEGDR